MHGLGGGWAFCGLPRLSVIGTGSEPWEVGSSSRQEEPLESCKHLEGVTGSVPSCALGGGFCKELRIIKETV